MITSTSFTKPDSRRRLYVPAFIASLLLTICGMARAATVYDSAGFESPRFMLTQNMDGQDPIPPVGQGPWQQDNGTSTAVVEGNNPVEGAQSITVTRVGTVTGNTRWGIVKPVTPSGVSNIVEILFDMRVTYAALGYGPLFGIEAYDDSLGGRKLIGSLFLDAGSGDVVCQEAGTGLYKATGVHLSRNVHHHYKLAINFTTKTCSLFADGALLHIESFVDPSAVAFTDAPITTLAAASSSETGKAYFDNYKVNTTTSAFGYLAWRGDGTINRWDVGVSSNWFDGITTAAFTNGAAVVFDDSGSNSPAIDLQGTLLPGSITVNASNNFTFNSTGSISGTGGLTKQGSGTLTLNGSHSYSGGTTVGAGTLLVNNSNGPGTGPVLVQTGGTLGGNGSIAGGVTVLGGGVLSPGTSVGTLTISNALTLTNGAVLRFELGTNSDHLMVSGHLRLSGAFDITDAGGFGPGTYNLISYGSTISNAGVFIASAPVGYDYSINTNTPGQINLVVTTPPLPPAAPSGLAATPVSPTQINLAWTDNSTNETNFLIERSLNNVTFNQIALTGAGATSYPDTGLAGNTTYYYR
ncbi:MAG: hypothetical protein EPO07_14265, partial [Verrucomicrobia bacterium]